MGLGQVLDVELTPGRRIIRLGVAKVAYPVQVLRFFISRLRQMLAEAVSCE
jgi:hypothetical protein